MMITGITHLHIWIYTGTVTAVTADTTVKQQTKSERRDREMERNGIKRKRRVNIIKKKEKTKRGKQRGKEGGDSPAGSTGRDLSPFWKIYTVDLTNLIYII